MSYVIRIFHSMFDKKVQYPDMDVYGLTETQASIIHSLTEMDR